MLKVILNTVLHTVLAYVLLLVLMRFLGRKAISQMTLFHFALAITLGSLTAHVSLMGDNSPAATIVALVTFAALGFLTDWIHIKSLKFRKLINSEPLVLIDRGHIVRANMVKARITLTELTKMLRIKSIFSLMDVNYAILENNGELSVLQKAENSPLTPHDMNLKPTEKKLARDLIMDGELLHENLEVSGMTERELFGRLNAMEISSEKQVFYAGLDSSGKLFVSQNDDGQEQAGKYGIE